MFKSCHQMSNHFHPFLGANFSGKYHPYTASNNNLHVLFQDEPHTALQNFSKNVNSAVCTCTVQPTYHPFSNQYYHSFSSYANHFTDKMLYPLLPYANFLHNRNWFYPSRWQALFRKLETKNLEHSFNQIIHSISTTVYM